MFARIRKTMDEKDSGFTLIELLVVMIIIGILAAIAIPTFLNQRKNGYRTELKADLKNAATAIESAAVDQNGDYGAIGVGAAYAALPATIPMTVSAGNTITAKTVGVPATGYCVKGINASLGGAAETWYFAKTEGTPNGTAVPVGC
jgi:prepilin-type N-terminal cleavage/methylation domain-containing protein